MDEFTASNKIRFSFLTRIELRAAVFKYKKAPYGAFKIPTKLTKQKSLKLLFNPSSAFATVLQLYALGI